MSAKTKSDRLRRLISHGYFAPELPPCFVSEDLARYRATIGASIDHLPLDQRGRPAHHTYVSECLWFYFPRFGRNDRRHAVPNPISYLLLARVLAQHYVPLRQLAKRSKISASPPIFDWVGSRALNRPNIDLRDDFRTDLAARREEFVVADIRAFFHSIYTHSIPWAIHGKAWAKTNRSVAHYGNLIDLLCRNMQDGQTIGLPVGPDTSRLIAEVVATSIDQKLREKVGVTSRDASRYIDDYTVSSDDGRTGESLIAALRQAAAYYELELNNDKSAIHSTSQRQSTGWKQAVRSHLPKNFDASSLQHFFYEVGRICEAHTDVNVEKYALQHARLALIQATEWSRVQSVLIGAYRRNSTLVGILVEVVLLRQVETGDVDLSAIRDFLEHRLPTLARENRTGEIVWLLFLSVRLGVSLSAESIAGLTEDENAMVALLVVYMRSLDLVVGDIDTQRWDNSLSAAGLTSPMWLYAYEAVVRGLVPNANDAFITNDPYFSLLKDRRVRFFQPDSGYESAIGHIRGLRGDNDRSRRIRDDFLEDFDLDFDELDDDEFFDEDIY